jgi:hypothetical protein
MKKLMYFLKYGFWFGLVIGLLAAVLFVSTNFLQTSEFGKLIYATLLIPIILPIWLGASFAPLEPPFSIIAPVVIYFLLGGVVGLIKYKKINGNQSI